MNFNSSEHSLSSITMLITEECNLRCSYCYIHKAARTMTESIAEKSVNFLFDNSGSNDRLGICFFGGEPLLEPKLLDYIATYASQKATEVGKSIAFSITTNATLISDSRLNLLKKHNISTTVSIDGIAGSHDMHRKTINGEGSFKMIERNMERLLSLKSIRIRLTVTPETASSMDASLKWLVEKGFRNVTLSPVYEADWSASSFSDYFDSLERLYLYQFKLISEGSDVKFDIISSTEHKLTLAGERGFGCGAARNMVAIDANGNMYPCHRFVGYFKNGLAQRIGHIDSGYIIRQREYYIKSSHTSSQKGCGQGLFDDDIQAQDKNCSSCSLSMGCGSSCMAISEHMNSDPQKPHPVNRMFAQIHASVHLQHRERLNKHNTTMEDQFTDCKIL